MFIVIGLVMLSIGALLLYVARPRGGEMASFLNIRFVEPVFALIVTVLIGIGAMAVLGGVVSLFTPEAAG